MGADETERQDTDEEIQKKFEEHFAKVLEADEKLSRLDPDSDSEPQVSRGKGGVVESPTQFDRVCLNRGRNHGHTIGETRKTQGEAF